MSNRALSLPHCYQPLTVAGIYRRYAIALLPAVTLLLAQSGAARSQILFGVLLGVVALDAAVAWLVRSESVAVGNGVYLSMVLVLLLPANISWYSAAAAVAITVCAKWFFGGVGRYWIHPAIVACVALSLSGDGAAMAVVDHAVPQWDAVVTQFMNEALFRRFEMAIPEGYLSALVAPDPARAGVSVALLAGSVYLLAHDLVSAVIPTLGILIFLVLGGLGGLALGGDFDPLLTMSTTPLILLIFFVVGEPTTAPHLHGGRSLYGIVLGLALVLTAGHDPSSVVYGVFLAALLVPVIDLLTDRTVTL